MSTGETNEYGCAGKQTHKQRLGKNYIKGILSLYTWKYSIDKKGVWRCLFAFAKLSPFGNFALEIKTSDKIVDTQSKKCCLCTVNLHHWGTD